MARSPQAHFFATRRDLEPGIQRIEAARALKYALCNLYEANAPKTYGSLLLVEDLGVSGTGDNARSPAYLVVTASESFHIEPVPQRRGGLRYSLSQQGNPRSIVVRPGGLYQDRCLVVGNVGTVSEHPDAVSLYREFLRELMRGFKKIRSYLVGPDALGLMDEGKRLVTMGVDEPPEYDLKR